MTKLGKYSLGTGDRFAHQAAAQLSAVTDAAEKGIQLDIVWNKSFREHKTIGSEPSSTRKAADEAVQAFRKANPGAAWKGAYYLDADHIGPKTVGLYIPYAEFYTLDVAEAIGKPGSTENLKRFTEAAKKWTGKVIEIEGLQGGIQITADVVAQVSEKYLFAAESAGTLYRSIAKERSGKELIIEVSMDETAVAQSPEEIFLILLALSLEEIPVQTLAPRFSGRFNKGVQYVGDPAAFELEFEKDALILRYAASALGFPENLKLSLHSGSDKFAIYPGINRVLKKHGVGLHVKTAGTTWLEEVIGLLEAGEADFVKGMYASCLERIEELTGPYAEVIDIDRSALPSVAEMAGASAEHLIAMLRHDLENPAYNASLRQLFHVGYKIAAEQGEAYNSRLEKHADIIAREVKTNLLDRHIMKIWG